MKPGVKKFLSITASLIGTFAVAEILLRVLSFYVPIYDIEMLKYAKELKVRSDIPGVVHQHRANASARLMGVEVRLNSMGHRNPELATPKPKTERRIHFIGSSILLGWGVPEDKGMVARTGQMLNSRLSPKTGLHYTVINAGIGNYNTYYEVELFARQVERTRPDLVVLQYYINDAEPNPTGRDNPLMMHSVAVALTYLRLKSLWLSHGGSLMDHYFSLYKPGQPDWERTKRSVRKLKAICDRRHIRLVVLLVPEIHDFAENTPYRRIYRLLGETFAKMGIHMVNPFEALRAAFGDDPSPAWVARDDPHPSAAVHEILARELVRYLMHTKF